MTSRHSSSFLKFRVLFCKLFNDFFQSLSLFFFKLNCLLPLFPLCLSSLGIFAASLW